MGEHNVMERAPNNIFIILLNWNRGQDTLECIASLHEKPNPANSHIVVVDNGSSDDSVERIHRNGGDLVFLEAGENRGFTGGNNLGLKYALEHNADYVLLLNNDALIAPDALSKMVAVAENDEKIGIVTPKILYHPERDRLWAAGTKYHEWCLTTRLTGYRQTDFGQYDAERDLVWATGCAMLIKREVLLKIGLLTDEMFAVGEDLDYGLRARKHGYRIRYAPSAVVWHKESISAGGHDAPQYVYYQTRNLVFLQRRWAKNVFHLLLAQMIAGLHFGKRVLILSIRGKWRSVLGLIYGWRDGLTGRLGKREYAALVNNGRNRRR